MQAILNTYTASLNYLKMGNPGRFVVSIQEAQSKDLRGEILKALKPKNTIIKSDDTISDNQIDGESP
jgi:hypothetical protein